MESIRSLKPNVTREQALRALRPGAFAWRRLRAIAELYLPFRLYEVEIVNRGRRQVRCFALDAVNGTLDLYGFARPPRAEEMVPVETRNRLQPSLDEQAAHGCIEEKVRRLLYLEGFFRLRDLQISVRRLPGDVHVPYWVGFYGRGERAELAVLDAVRRRREGAKLRRLLYSWLTSSTFERLLP